MHPLRYVLNCAAFLQAIWRFKQLINILLKAASCPSLMTAGQPPCTMTGQRIGSIVYAQPGSCQYVLGVLGHSLFTGAVDGR